MHALAPGQDAWHNENLSRNTMTLALKAAIAEHKPDIETLVLMSDVDEIPSAHTIQLARTCDFGPSMHLQLRDFIYRYVPSLTILSHRLITCSTALNGSLATRAGEQASISGCPTPTTDIPRAQRTSSLMQDGIAVTVSEPSLNTLPR